MTLWAVTGLALIAGLAPNARAQAPLNDNFTNALVLDAIGTPGSVTDSTVNSTRQTNEPIHYIGSPRSSNSVWFSWTAPETGIVTFDTIDNLFVGSFFDTVLAAYRLQGTNGLGSLIQLASDDDSGGGLFGFASKIQFPVVQGTNYYIALDGYRAGGFGGGFFNNSTGTYVLNWRMGTNPPVTLDTIQFLSTTYSVSEAGPVATITVLYGGDSSGGANGPVSVDFFTADGTALNGTHYLGTNGTLVFEPGETVKTFDVPILNNTSLNNNKTVFLALLNPTNAELGAFTSSAVLTIVDDEVPVLRTAGTFNFSSSTFFGTENETTAAAFATFAAAASLPAVSGSAICIVRDVNLPPVCQRGPFGVVVTVTRSAPATGRVFVDYNTEVRPLGGIIGPIFSATFPAKQGIDFTPTSGTLVFDDYQMSASFIVPVFSNFVSNNASAVFSVVLSNPRAAAEEDINAPETIIPVLGSQSVASVTVYEVNETFKRFSFERVLTRYDEYNPLQNTIPSTNGVRTITVDVLLPGGGGSATVRMLHNTRASYLHQLATGSDYATLDRAIFPNTPFTDGRGPIITEPDFTDFQNAALTFPTTGDLRFRQKATFTITNDNTVEFNEDISFDLVNVDFTGGYTVGPFDPHVTILFDDQPAGAADREWNPELVYTTQPPFNTTPGANNSVSALAVQADGRTVLVGDFTAVNSVSRNRVARYNQDGSVDLSFNPGTGADAFVTTVAICTRSPNAANLGKIMVGGGFSSFDGSSRNGLARLNANGSLDTTFKPGNGADGPVYSIALQSDGKIVVAGDFTHFNDLPANGIMRLNEDGTLDTTFDAGTGANGTVWSVAVHDTVAPFSVSRSSAASGDRNVIDTGSTLGAVAIDYDFTPGADNIRVYYEGVRVLDLTTNGGGQILVPYGPGLATSIEIVMNEVVTGGDWFYQATVIPALAGRSVYLAGEFTGFNGQPLRGVARLNENGSVDSTFNPGVSVNGPVYAMAVQPNNRVLLGGSFAQFQNASRPSLVRLLANGALDVDFHIGTGADDAIYAITLQPDGKIFIGGVFQNYNGTRRMGLARLFNNGALDTSFMDTAYNQFAGLIKTYSFDPPRYVNAIALQADGDVMIGGSFTNLGGNFSYNNPSYAFANLHAPFTRADKVTRFNVARLIGGYTDGPGNIEFDPEALPFSVDENAGFFVAPLRRVDGRLGSAFASSAIAPNTATIPDDLSVGSAFDPTWPEAYFVAPRSVGFTGFNYFQIPINDDGLKEGDETFDLSAASVGGSLTLGNSFFFGGGFFTGLGGEYIPLGAARGYFDSVRVTIADNDFDRGEFNFSQDNFIVDENSGQATITVLRTNGSSGPVSVRVLVQNGTALAGEDYVAPAGAQTLSFASGQTSRTFTVDLLNNPIVEGDETVTLILTNTTGGATLPGGTAISTAVATLTIVDDDFLAGRLNFSTTNFLVGESATQAVVTVTRTGGNLGLLSVQYATADDTATAPADYAARSGTLTWNSGDSSAKTIIIPLVADGLVEGTESVNLRLFNSSLAGALGDRTNAVLTILDGDAYGTLSFSQPYYNVGENDASPTITVVRSGGIGGTISVSYATVALTATNGLDYIDTSGQLTFLPGELSKTFQIQVLNDTDIDGDKTFAIVLSAPVNASLGLRSNVIVTLVDDESISAPAGSLDTTFSSSATANGAVYALALQTNGAVIMAGDFTEVGSVPRSRIARLRENGILDPTFDIGPGANGSIRALALQSDGRLLVGGLFTTINATNRNGLARLSLDGKVDISFNPGAGADNPVLALSVQPDDRVLVGGSFSTFRGVSSPGLVRLNTNGTIDISFSVGAGFNGSVYAVEQQSDGRLLVGGNFISYNGLPRTNLVRLNANGTLDAGFNPALALDAPVQAIQAEPDGRMVIGGAFTSVNGFTRRYLARLDQGGLVDPGFMAAPDAGADNVIFAIKQQVDGKLVVGGDFKKFNGVTRNGITRLNDGDGTTDPTINFGKGANALVAALAIQPDRKILLGGGFTAYDGQSRQYLARIYGGSISGPGTLEFELPVFTASESGSNAVITVRRRGGTAGAVSVHYATANGSALAGQDYLGAAGDLSFVEGETFQAFNVALLPNTLPDGDRLVQLSLSNFAGAAAGPQPDSTLVIQDDESTVRFTAPEYSVSESPVSGHATIGVFRSGGTNSTVTVDFATGPGTAVAGADYTAASGSLTFLPGQVFQNFNVPIQNDILIEGNETLSLTLFNPSAGTALGLAAAVLVIVDNDFSPGQFTFPTNRFVVDEAAGNALITVVRTNGSIGPVSVRLRTSNGTALSGLDYTGTDRVLSFADGEVVKSVAVPINNDALIEPSETFTVTLSEPSVGTSLLSGSATVTILDNDAGIIVGAGVTLVSESILPADGIIQPGETVTVQLGLRNMGVVDSSSVMATLVYASGVSNAAPQTQNYGNLLAGGSSASRPFTFTALGTNGSHITATLLLTSAGTTLLPVSFEFVLGQESLPFQNGSPITINDNAPASPYPSTLTVANVTGPVNKLTVTLHGLTHRYPDDLDILLVGPTGAKVMLMSDAGGNNINALNNATITFDDAAARVIPDQTIITNGSYRAANYLAPFTDTMAPFAAGTVWTNTALATFNGLNPNGVWSLYVVDDSGTDSGSIASGWSLNIQTATPIGSAADVRVTAAAPAGVESGRPFSYTLTVANNGPAEATGVTLTDTLPAGFLLNTVTVSQGTSSTGSGTITASLGSLGAGASATVTISGVVVGPRTLTNGVNVTAAQSDSNLANNTVSTVTVVAAPRLSIRRVGANTVVEWLSPSTGYTLETSASASGPWAAVVSGITTANGINSFTVPAGVSAFYRLRKP